MSISKALACLLAVVTSVTTLVVSVHAGPVSGQGTWETTLQSRDLDGDGKADAFYDTTLNITWLRNANATITNSNPSGELNWDDANTWAANLTVGGYGNWRLPTLLNGGGYTPSSPCNWSLIFAGSGNCGYNVLSSTSEMASLWFDTLGNTTSSGLSNTGDFIGLQGTFNYWLGTSYLNDPHSPDAWYFYAGDGEQWASGFKGSSTLHALAVHDGNLQSAQVPEPNGLLLVLTCLMCLGLAYRRTRHFAMVPYRARG